MARQLTDSEFNLDISNVDFSAMKGRISTEDLERLETEKPATL